MNDRIHPFKQPGGKLSDVAEMLGLESVLGKRRSGDTVGEITGVEAQELGFRPAGAEVPDDDRAEVAHVAGDEDSHGRGA
jgi:hypothetical protein